MNKSKSMGNLISFNPGKELIENLESIRLKKKQTKAQFAVEELKISPSYYNRIINNKINPTLEAVGKFSERLGIDYSALLLSSLKQEMYQEQFQNSFQYMKDIIAEVHKLEQKKLELEREVELKTNKDYELTN